MDISTSTSPCTSSSLLMGVSGIHLSMPVTQGGKKRYLWAVQVKFKSYYSNGKTDVQAIKVDLLCLQTCRYITEYYSMVGSHTHLNWYVVLWISLKILMLRRRFKSNQNKYSTIDRKFSCSFLPKISWSYSITHSIASQYVSPHFVIFWIPYLMAALLPAKCILLNGWIMTKYGTNSPVSYKVCCIPGLPPYKHYIPL